MAAASISRTGRLSPRAIRVERNAEYLSGILLVDGSASSRIPDFHSASAQPLSDHARARRLHRPHDLLESAAAQASHRRAASAAELGSLAAAHEHADPAAVRGDGAAALIRGLR